MRGLAARHHLMVGWHKQSLFGHCFTVPLQWTIDRTFQPLYILFSYTTVLLTLPHPSGTESYTPDTFYPNYSYKSTLPDSPESLVSSEKFGGSGRNWGFRTELDPSRSSTCGFLTVGCPYKPTDITWSLTLCGPGVQDVIGPLLCLIKAGRCDL